MFENPRRGRQASNFTTNVPKILDLKSSSEQIFFRKLSLGAPALETSKVSAILVFTTKTTQSRPQVFSVNGALTCRRLHFLNTKFSQIWPSVAGYGAYACDFSQSELGKYFE